VVMYATVSELASFLKQDVDTSTATLALTIASDLFADRANTRFESNTATYSVASIDGTANYRIYLPHTPSNRGVGGAGQRGGDHRLHPHRATCCTG
jgi:hypothetical protein